MLYHKHDDHYVDVSIEFQEQFPDISAPVRSVVLCIEDMNAWNTRSSRALVNTLFNYYE